MVLPTLGALSGVARFYVDRAERRLAGERATAEIEKVRGQVETIRDYAEVAKLNYVGTTGTVGMGLVETTAISRALAAGVEVVGNTSKYRCDDQSLQTFRDVAVRFPRFPFSHYALAFCLQQRGDDAWKEHAREAVEILRHTTAIDGHHPNHDHALREIELALSR